MAEQERELRRTAVVLILMFEITEWYKDHGVCMRHGCLMDIYFSPWLPKGEAAAICPKCQRETLHAGLFGRRIYGL